MADAFQYTGSLNYSTLAYQRAAYYSLRPPLMYDSIADVFATQQSHPGSAVQFNILGDLAVASSPINELSDVAAVTTSATSVSAVLNEYGNALVRTKALAGTSFIEIDPALARVIGFNGGVSVDDVAREAASTGTVVAYPAANGHTARNQLTSADIITSNDVRIAYSTLLTQNAMPFVTGSAGEAGTDGMGPVIDVGGAGAGTGYFAAMIHPQASYDLRSQTGSGSWRTPKEYSDPSDIWAGEIGIYEGFRFIVNPRAPYFVNAGASSENVLGTLFLGQEALLKIWSMVEENGPRPVIIEGPVVDRLKRFRPLGWYWFGAYAIFRQTDIYRLETTATLAGSTAGGDQPSINL